MRKPLRLDRSFIVAALACLVMGYIAGAAFAADESWRADVEAALKDAGDNRAQLEKVLTHFRDSKDEQKFKAACFLIANMPGHGFIETAFKNEKGDVVPFDALEHESFEKGFKRLNDLEKEHGPLHTARLRVVYDTQTVTADFLIDDIDRAFEAWRNDPWAKDVSFGDFCEYILPYRGTEEPAEAWRAACRLDPKTVAESIDPSDVTSRKSPLTKTANAIRQITPYRVRFNQLYYLHPTDQGFSQLRDKPVGRCEDQSNMNLYVLRANAIPATGDYVPLWGHANGNHMWEVVIDHDPASRHNLSGRAAKVFRSTYSTNPRALKAMSAEGEPTPRHIAKQWFRDVTDEYAPVTDVTVKLTTPAPEGTTLAYICVFNFGQWLPIYWAKIDDGVATFENMGRGIAYMPAYYTDKDEIVPAGSPFILSPDGSTTPLSTSTAAIDQIAVASVAPEAGADATQPDFTLMVWRGGEFKPLATFAEPKLPPAVLAGLPADTVFWFKRNIDVEDESPQRIFTVRAGEMKNW